jgi:hypothetical protein
MSLMLHCSAKKTWRHHKHDGTVLAIDNKVVQLEIGGEFLRRVTVQLTDDVPHVLD